MTAVESSDQRSLEPFAAVLLAVAAFLVAWTAFQGTTWASEVAALGRKANAARVESSKDLSRLNQVLISDQLLYTSFVIAQSDGNDEAARIIAAEFRPEFARLVTEWLERGGGVPTPFDDPTYTVLDELEAAIENTEASEAFADDASEATERRNQYAAATVILALVLFLVGIGMTFKRRSVNIASLVLGGALLVITALYAATLPVVF